MLEDREESTVLTKFSNPCPVQENPAQTMSNYKVLP